MDNFIIAGEADYISRTGLHTFPASRTPGQVYNGKSILIHIHSLKGAGFHTVTVSQTGIETGLFPSDQVGSGAAFHSPVDLIFNSLPYSTAAENSGHLGDLRILQPWHGR